MWEGPKFSQFYKSRTARKFLFPRAHHNAKYTQHYGLVPPASLAKVSLSVSSGSWCCAQALGKLISQCGSPFPTENPKAPRPHLLTEARRAIDSR